jgi:hypothetical protein
MDVEKRKRNRDEERRKRYCRRCINVYVGGGYDRCSISGDSVLRLQTDTQAEKKKRIIEREQFLRSLCSQLLTHCGFHVKKKRIPIWHLVR